MLKRTTKPLKRRLLTGEDLARSTRETLGNANQNKTTRAGHKKVSEKTHQRKHSKIKEPREMLNKTKTLTTIAR